MDKEKCLNRILSAKRISEWLKLRDDAFEIYRQIEMENDELRSGCEELIRKTDSMIEKEALYIVANIEDRG